MGDRWRKVAEQGQDTVVAVVAVLPGVRWRCRHCGAEFLVADEFDPALEEAEYHMRSEHGVNKPEHWMRVVGGDDHSMRMVAGWYSFALGDERSTVEGRIMSRRSGLPF